ncbi:MAG TPA: pyruvate dehydrogenase (acetyl-transferring) E1 component subunit alpha [Mycobacteriales bacterium]
MSTVDPDFVQLLTEDGELRSHPDHPLTLSEQGYRSLYRDLVMVRRIDTEATALQRQGELGLWVPCLGQEAAQVGSGRALRPSDHAFPSYREHGVAWCRGIEPLTLLEMWRGVTNGGWDPARTNFHLYTLVVGAQVLHATGYAMGVARDGLDDAVVAYFGDGACSQGDVNEAFSFAGVFDAPIVFFCQNNHWAISAPVSRQSRLPLYQRAHGFGFPGVRVDGNDVLACLAVTRTALDHARSGNGPFLIEAYTYRMGAHTTSDDPTRYRSPDEVAHWQARDPIARLASLLRREGMADGDFLAAVGEEADVMAARLRSECRTMPDPDPLTMFNHVYAEPHGPVSAERDWYERYLESFVGTDQDRR